MMPVTLKLNHRAVKRIAIMLMTATLLVSLLVPLLSSCSKENKDTVMSFRGEELTAGMLSYMMASQKAYVKEIFTRYTADYYSEHGEYPYGTNDFEEFLNLTFPNEGNGLTYAQNANNTVLNTAKMFVVVNYFCKKYNLVVTDNTVIENIEQNVNDDINTAGGLVFLNEILEKYQADVNTEREYLYNMARTDLLYDYLYGDYGIQRVADSIVSETFYGNYRKIDFIYYSYYNYDTETGDRISYGEEIIADMNTEAEDLYTKLTSGEINFNEYSDHDDYAKYDEGVCYTQGKLAGDIETAADGLENYGDICKMVSEDGVYILRLLEADDEDLAVYYDEVYEQLSKTAFYDYIESYYAEIKADGEAIGKYDFADIEALLVE
ncbi:MAG: hypothetical protein PHW77_07540 [Eubacteriales bacterium]|nr:hypothetical protein [Eubacteriales bacterium]